MIAKAIGVDVRCRILFRQAKSNRPKVRSMINHLRKGINMGAALLHPQPPFTEEKRSVDQELIKDIPVIVVIERAVDDA